MNELKMKIDGQPCTTYFFATWTGYSHPVKLQNPLTFAEVQRQKVYYEGSLAVDGEVPRIVRCRKWQLRREPLPAKDVPPDANPGASYFAVRYDDEKRPHIASPLNPEEAAEAKEYIHCELSSEGKITLLQLVRKEFVYSFTYLYNTDGSLKQVTVQNSEGTRIINE